MVMNPHDSAGDKGDTVCSLGREDPLEEEMATCSSVPAWESMDRGAWWATVYGSQRVRHE